MNSNKHEVTRVDFEGTGIVVELVQEPSSHAICEYCNKPVPFPMVRKFGDIPMCIDCLAKEANTHACKENESFIGVSVGAYGNVWYLYLRDDTAVSFKILEQIKHRLVEISQDVQFHEEVDVYTEKLVVYVNDKPVEYKL